jgi:hypothetical protein
MSVAADPAPASLAPSDSGGYHVRGESAGGTEVGAWANNTRAPVALTPLVARQPATGWRRCWAPPLRSNGAGRGVDAGETGLGSARRGRGVLPLSRDVREDVDDRPARVAEHEPSHSPVLITERIGNLEAALLGLCVDRIDIPTSTEIPGAAMSSPLTIVTWTDGLVGDATVTTQPMSMATSKPNRSTKKSRVSAGRSERMLGTALLALLRSSIRPD